MQSLHADRTGSSANAMAPDLRSPSTRSKPRTLAQRGQVLVIFVLSIFVLIGFVAIVIDISWYWSNTLRLQRAADAAALAGAVQLPGNPQTGYSQALAEAAKNGYNIGSPANMTCVNALPLLVSPADKKLEICATQDQNPNQMDVAITAPVPTFASTDETSRRSRLPVPISAVTRTPAGACTT